MLAAQAIETLHEAKPQKIVVSCAHCFNTIAGEFPELGGHFEVVHHTQLLNRLVREGRLTPVAAPGAAKPAAGTPGAAKPVAAEPGAAAPSAAAEPGEQGETLRTPLHVTYHDACYLGRHNKIFAPPRELVASLPGVELVEMPRHADRAMCCGAGGAHAWFEESRGTRIADARIAEAASTGADVVATACPFCSQMLGSASGASAGLFPVLPSASSASAGVGDSDSARLAPDASTGESGGAGAQASAGVGAGAPKLPLVKDVAIMLLESVRRGQKEHPGERE